MYISIIYLFIYLSITYLSIHIYILSIPDYDYLPIYLDFFNPSDLYDRSGHSAAEGQIAGGHHRRRPPHPQRPLRVHSGPNHQV